MKHINCYALAISIWLFSAIVTVQAEQWDIAGSIAAEIRLFPNKPAFAEQNDSTVSPSFSVAPELVYEWNQDKDRLTFIPFVRWDKDDDNRTHADIREANWLHIGARWDILIGIGKVFWGVTESRHLVDIINQTDGVEDIDGEDKLGQPMIRLNLTRDWGTLNFFVLPGFRERTFPANNARLRGPLPIDTDNPSYESSAKDKHVDIAMRWSHTIDEWDIGVAHFDGTSREPRLLSTTRSGQTVFVPHYDQITQTSLDIQFTGEATLWKLEAITREGYGDRFFAAVAGLEYTFYQVIQNRADLGVLLEYLYDDRNRLSAPLTTTDDDFFIGARLTLNDIHDTTFLAGAIIDRHTQTTLYNLEVERRLDDHWKLAVEGRLISHVSESDPLIMISKDDFVSVQITRYF